MWSNNSSVQITCKWVGKCVHVHLYSVHPFTQDAKLLTYSHTDRMLDELLGLWCPAEGHVDMVSGETGNISEPSWATVTPHVFVIVQHHVLSLLIFSFSTTLVQIVSLMYTCSLFFQSQCMTKTCPCRPLKRNPVCKHYSPLPPQYTLRLQIVESM